MYREYAAAGDRIVIKGLRIYANHGVYQEEKDKGQNFVINAVLYTDFRKSNVSDSIEDATDYGRVCNTINNVMLRESCNLIETAAEKTAVAILEDYPEIKRVELELGKPDAPVPMNFDMISVMVEKEWEDVYLSLGSNIGDREMYLDLAVEALESIAGIRVIDTSEYINTKAYGYEEQEDFLNAVCHIQTYLSPLELLELIHGIEKGNGRTREIHWGPRTLDIDILLYGSYSIDSSMLCIPHEDMCNREFVLGPMNEIAPFVRHPLTGKTMKELYRELQERGTKIE